MLALTLVLLVCAMTVSVSAAEETTTPSVSIDKFNLVFEDNVYLKYAVKFDGVEDGSINADNIGMLYFSTPQENYVADNATYTSSVVGYTTINDVKYYTFEYRHITAKQMTDYVYSVAYIDVDGERYYSAPNKFSVLEYAYAKLGKTGVASDNEDFRAMLESMLEYGANAQKYFNYNTERLANADYFLVEAIGGALEDGFTKGLYHANETATLTAPEAEEGFKFAGWKNSAGEVVSTDNPASLTAFAKNDTYTATYKETVKYSEGLEFTSNGDGTCYVSGIGTCTDSDISIPPVSPDGDKVTAIGNSAFERCTSFTSIEIPDSVIRINNSAFQNCYQLTSIEIPNGVAEIGAWAFGNCGLMSVVIPNSLTTVETYAFANCFDLTEVTCPVAILDNVIYDKETLRTLTLTGNSEYWWNNSIETDTLKGYKGLEKLTIGEGVEYIDEWAFEDCNELANVVIHSENITINEWALEGCTTLTSFVSYARKLVVYGGAFDGCISLAELVIYGDEFEIYDGAFEGCISLKEATCHTGIVPYLPKKELQTLIMTGGDYDDLNGYSFDDCVELVSIGIPDTWTWINGGMFTNSLKLSNIYITDIASWCSMGQVWILMEAGETSKNIYLNNELITEVIIPEGVTNIESGAFSNCYYLTSVVIPDSVTTIGWNAFRYCGFTSVKIPDNVTYIGNYAFWGCGELTSIVIGDSVATICDRAFEYCDNLTSVYYKGTKSDWNEIDICTDYDGNGEVITAVRYYFSENEPTGAGKYWHYVDGVPTVWPKYKTPTITDEYIYCDEDGNPDENGSYILFGEYPQTIKADDVDITATTDNRGYYLGSDGNYYAKVTANPYNSGYTFSTGAPVSSGTTYYFKVEPIRWRILTEEDGKAFILCDSIIANVAYQSDCVYEDENYYTTANGAPEGTYANNYKYSDVRKWLNEIFYTTAFNDIQRELIVKTLVDNSTESTGNSSNPYACEDTEDNIFLLSRAEVTDDTYGFSTNTVRRMKTSDYSRATGACTNTGSSYYANGYWWLRSPFYHSDDYADCARALYSDGYVGSYCVYSSYFGVVPALWIRL